MGGKLAFDTEYNRLKITMKEVFQAKTYTRGCFENNSANFYFLTYEDTSDFVCAYCELYDYTNIYNANQYTVNITSISPLEFFDDVEIQANKIYL